ncbi:MAG: PEP-CTERM sorting domain-containing protein [Tistlia sp.]|uniref:PEP-CTERM sorting domain-containing protein n=1 Tax=Tistlia sp. TaxID=3057121 RepID=UPI0034A5961C
MKSLLRAIVFTAIVASVPTAASAGVMDFDTGYLWRFTGQITGIEEAVHPDVSEAPFMDIGDPVYAAIGLNYAHLPPDWFNENRVGNAVTWPGEALSYSGGGFAASFETDIGLVTPGPSGTEELIRFDLVTGEIVHVEGVGYTYFDRIAFWWGVDGGRIQQVANIRGYAFPSHFFTYEGAWEVVRVQPVPEPNALTLMLLGGVALAAAATRRRPRRG